MRTWREALGIAAPQEVQTNLRDVRKLRLELEPWRDSQAVKNFDEQLREVAPSIGRGSPIVSDMAGKVSPQAGSAEPVRDRRRTGTCRAPGND
jgi:hypothetical protein